MTLHGNSWVGFGLNPSSQMVDVRCCLKFIPEMNYKADFIVGAIGDDGKAYVMDGWSSDFIAPSDDSKLGGQYNLFDARYILLYNYNSPSHLMIVS